MSPIIGPTEFHKCAKTTDQYGVQRLYCMEIDCWFVQILTGSESHEALLALQDGHRRDIRRDGTDAPHDRTVANLVELHSQKLTTARVPGPYRPARGTTTRSFTAEEACDALQQLRERHAAVFSDFTADPICGSPHGSAWKRWPCEDAKILYSNDEIAEVTR